MSERDRKPPSLEGFEEEQAEFLRPQLRAARMDAEDSIPLHHDDLDDDPFDGLVGNASLNAAFTADDAKLRKGNYIIPFGLPGSGKTTFLASLFKYIDESPLLDSQIVVPERRKVPNYAGQAMLNEWQRIFNAGRFLGATQVGDIGIRELTYDVRPNKGQRTKLTFNVIEVSGEDLVKVIANMEHDPRLPAALEAVFMNKSIRPLIALIVHPNQIENDLLFANLTSWLSRNVKHRIGAFPLAVIIANPSLALARLHKRRPETKGQDRLGGKLSLLYLQEFAPQTFAIYNGWSKSKRAISPLYVGEIEKNYDNDELVERISQFDNRNSSQVFGWIYYQFTGRKLGRSLMQRLFKMINE